MNTIRLFQTHCSSGKNVWKTVKSFNIRLKFLSIVNPLQRGIDSENHRIDSENHGIDLENHGIAMENHGIDMENLRSEEIVQIDGLLL